MSLGDLPKHECPRCGRQAGMFGPCCSAPQASQPPQGAADRDLLLRCLGMIPLGAWVRAGTCYNECKAAIDRLAASPPPATQEPADWVPIPESASEREQWEQMVKTIGNGDVRLAIATSLRIWARMSPGGSYAAQCAIMANEVVKLYAAPAPVSPEGRGGAQG